MRHDSAFTLIEVLIALLILAIALFACVLTASKVTKSTIHIDQSIAAHWVATNVLAQMQVGLLPVPKSQIEIGNARMLNRQWQWQAVLEPDNTNYMQVSLSVFFQGKKVGVLDGALPE